MLFSTHPSRLAFWFRACVVVVAVGLILTACSQREYRPESTSATLSPTQSVASNISSAAASQLIATPQPTASQLPATIVPATATPMATATAIVARVAQSQRPIATMDISKMTPVAKVFSAEPLPSPTSTITESTATIPPPTAAPTLISQSTAEPVTVQNSVSTARDALRNLVFILNQSTIDGLVPCADFTRDFAIIEASPDFVVSAELKEMHRGYRAAVEKMVATGSNLHAACTAHITEYGLNQATLTVADIDPATDWLDAVEGSRSALADIYAAVSALNIQPNDMRQIFSAVRNDIFAYGTTVRQATVEDCTVIAEQYAAVITHAPRFSTPNDYRQMAYGHYMVAIDTVAAGGSQVAAFCNNPVVDSAETTTDNEPQMIPEAARQAAWVGRGAALHEVDLALTAIAPTPTNTATPLPTHTPWPPTAVPTKQIIPPSETPIATATYTPTSTLTSAPTLTPTVAPPTATPTPTHTATTIPTWPTATPWPTRIPPTNTPPPTRIPPTVRPALPTKTPWPTRTVAPTLTPSPTVVPFTAVEVYVRSAESYASGQWVIHFELTFTGGQPPYYVEIGDFSGEGELISVVYNCGAAFIDKVIATDATWTTVESEPVYVSNEDVCN